MSKKGNLIWYKYRHIIGAIIILSIIIVLNIILENYTNKTMEKVNGDLNKIYEELKDNKEENIDIQKIKDNSKYAIEEWEKNEKILDHFMEHDDVGKINVKLNQIDTQIETDMLEDAQASTNEAIILINYLISKHKLSLENLF